MTQAGPPLRTAFLWAMIVSLSLAALLGIAVLILPDYGPQEEILASTALFGAASLVALLCATVIEKRRWVWLMWTGIALAVAALGVWLFLLWFEHVLGWSVEENLARTGGTLSVAAILIAHAGLLSLPHFDRRATDVVRWATVGAAVLLADVIVLLLWWMDVIEDYVDEDVLFRGMGVLGILSGCGTVVTPILWKMQQFRRRTVEGAASGRLRVRIVCPRCHTSQALRTGPTRCRECGLRIDVTVEEPRCACGYLLYRLVSDRCPECGRHIPEKDRWGAVSGGSDDASVRHDSTPRAAESRGEES